MHRKSFSTKNVCQWRGPLPCYVLICGTGQMHLKLQKAHLPHKHDADSIIWYTNYPMGKNKLGTFMGTASKAMGITIVWG